MLRFIVERHESDLNTGLDRKDYVTLDVEIEELEDLLRRGGKGENKFESWKLIGAEIWKPNAAISGGEAVRVD